MVTRADDGTDDVVAEFELVDGFVLARYPHDSLGFARRMFEEDGLVVYQRIVRVSDGAAFFDGLEVGLASSSRLGVRT